MADAGVTWESEREGVVGDDNDGIGRAGRGRLGVGIPSGSVKVWRSGVTETGVPVLGGRELRAACGCIP